MRPGVVAALAALAIGIGFVLETRGDGLSARDWFVAVMLASAVITGIGGTALPDARGSGVVLAWTSGALIGIGSLSLGSFGIPLLVAGLVAVPAWLSTLEGRTSSRAVVEVAASLSAAFTAVAIGIVLTD